MIYQLNIGDSMMKRRPIMSNILFQDVKYYSDKIDAVKELLAYLLTRGNLALIIGAGVSKYIKFPDMKTLIKRCYIKAELTKYTEEQIDKKDPKELLILVENIEEKYKSNPNEYYKLVKECLYSGITNYTNTIIESKMHLALGALIANSHRGCINKVITLNFDDALETFLKILGFKTQIITKNYYLTESNSDVVIYHPHGYLPKESNNNSEELIFSQYSFDLRISQSDNRWNKIFENMLLDYIVLFVGVSGNDPVFGPMLANAKEINKEHGRPTGVWLFGPSKQNGGLQDDYFYSRDIILYHFNDYNEIPLFLLEVCQLASNIE